MNGVSVTQSPWWACICLSAAGPSQTTWSTPFPAVQQCALPWSGHPPGEPANRTYWILLDRNGSPAEAFCLNNKCALDQIVTLQGALSDVAGAITKCSSNKNWNRDIIVTIWSDIHAPMVYWETCVSVRYLSHTLVFYHMCNYWCALVRTCVPGWTSTASNKWWSHLNSTVCVPHQTLLEAPRGYSLA